LDISCTYTKRDGSTEGPDPRMRIERQVNVGIVELCEVGIEMGVEGRSNGSTRDIRAGLKRAGGMIQAKENNFSGGLAKRN
jgi:hypothetical protein